MKPGRPGCPIREAWTMRFNLPQVNDRRVMTDSICRQLSFCRDDEARRLILGIRDS
jgi:hypothetical protein